MEVIQPAEEANRADTDGKMAVGEFDFFRNGKPYPNAAADADPQDTHETAARKNAYKKEFHNYSKAVFEALQESTMKDEQFWLMFIT